MAYRSTTCIARTRPEASCNSLGLRQASAPVGRAISRRLALTFAARFSRCAGARDMLEASGTKLRVGLRERIAALFDDEAHQSGAAHYFNAGLAAMIVVNVGAVILESVEPIRVQHQATFFAI